MDFKNVTFYPEFFVDLVIYVLVAVALLLLSKYVWDWKEERRLRREMADYVQRKEEEVGREN